MSVFKPGEVVDITIKGARVQRSGPDDIGGRFLSVIYGDHNHHVTLDMKPEVTVERVSPPEWPPRPGDLWRDMAGIVWFATDVHDVDRTDVPEVRLVRAYEGAASDPVDKVLKLYGPLTLVHREPEPSREEVPW